MASVTKTPPMPPVPPPPMRPRQPRSFAGPIVLIVIGLFCLFGNLGMIEWYRIWSWFGNYWPALLILWGVIKVIEYQNANRAGVPPRGIGAGGVLLVIVLVFMGLTARETSRVNWQEFRDRMHIEGDVPWWGHTYDYTDNLQQAFPAGESLRVNNERGAINVTTSNDNNIHLTIHKRVNPDP